jgi:putative transcriptional regulator
MSKSIVQNNIRKLRFNADEMTQQQLADLAGVSRQTIVAIEKGNYSPSLELAFRLSYIFKTPLEDVFSYDPDEDQSGRKK